MPSEEHILNGLERLAEVLKSQLWDQGKAHGLSPIQIQILLFVANHETELCNVSQLAREFQVTKPTISDAVRVLVQKSLLAREHGQADARRYNLRLTPDGTTLATDLKQYATPVLEALGHLSSGEQTSLYATLTKLIFQLHRKGVIQIQRTCFACRFYHGNRQDEHYCQFLKTPLSKDTLRLDCPEFEA